jgi:membrane protein YqaA with SNARE-associated domain
MINDPSEPTSGKTGFSWRRSFDVLHKKGFFRYLGRGLLLIFSVYLVIVLVVFMLGNNLVDFKTFFAKIIEQLSDRFVILLFFISESIAGMIPPDLFVIWTQKFERPLPWLALLGVLSYLGGVVSYGIGTWISRRPRIRAYSERKLYKYMEFVRKWGGAFIVIAALFPFTPFSLVVVAVTLFRYPFRMFLLYAMARLVRFVLQGFFFFDLLKLHHWII